MYRTAEDVCMHKMSARLYDRLKTEFERETSEIMKRLSGVLGDAGSLDLQTDEEEEGGPSLSPRSLRCVGNTT